MEMIKITQINSHLISFFHKDITDISESDFIIIVNIKNISSLLFTHFNTAPTVANIVFKSERSEKFLIEFRLYFIFAGRISPT